MMMRSWRSRSSQKERDVVVVQEVVDGSSGISGRRCYDVGGDQLQDGVAVSTSEKLVQAIEDARLSCLGVQERLMKENKVPRINGTQADYLKQSLLWLQKPLMLQLYLNMISFLRDRALSSTSESRSFRTQRELDHALLFSANTLWELSKVMHKGEALVVDCIGSTKEWQQLVILESVLASHESILAARKNTVSNSVEPLWSPFYLILRDLHHSHALVEKAYGELNAVCGYVFDCIPPDVAKKSLEHHLEKDKHLCQRRAVKDTDNLFFECKQIVSSNRSNTSKFRCAKYVLGKIDLRYHPEPGGIQANHLPEFLLIDNHNLVGNSDSFADGGYGYVSDREWLKIPLAAKTLKTESVSHENIILFYEEVALLARVEHPHVVRLVGHCRICQGQEMTRNRVVMEKMSTDLRKLLDNTIIDPACPDQVPFPTPVALDLIMQLAEALKFLKIQRVMHRDIKAKNILVNLLHPVQSITRAHQSPSNLQYYRLKLTDLGCAQYKLPQNSWCSKKMLGATNWRAPEVFKDNADHYSWPADIYGFAMTCYEILSGKMPFPDVPTVTHDRLCDGERPSLPRSCQPELAALVRRCWATRPIDRPDIFQVCKELMSCKEELLRRYYTTSLTPAEAAMP